MARTKTLLAAALALGCSSRQPTTTTTTTAAPPPAADASVAATADVAPTSPWDALDRAGLSRVVTDGATARLHEVQPELDLARLADYVAHPDQCPEIKGRAADQLTDLAVVAVANDRLDDARGIVRLIRARARNRNLAYMGTMLLAEVARC